MPDRLRSPQGGGGRRRSPRGGGDDRRSSQDDEFGRRRSPHGAATRAGELPRAALSEFRVGQEVEYLSSTYKEWIEGKVIAINADGTLDLDVREAADPSNVRHVGLADQRSPNRGGRRSRSRSPRGGGRRASPLQERARALGLDPARMADWQPRWEYDDGGGRPHDARRWVAYRESDSEKLEQSFIGGRTRTVIGPYEIDLKRNRQTNTSTGRGRDIRRLLPKQGSPQGESEQPIYSPQGDGRVPRPDNSVASVGDVHVVPKQPQPEPEPEPAALAAPEPRHPRTGQLLKPVKAKPGTCDMCNAQIPKGQLIMAYKHTWYACGACIPVPLALAFPQTLGKKKCFGCCGGKPV